MVPLPPPWQNGAVAAAVSDMAGRMK